MISMPVPTPVFVIIMILGALAWLSTFVQYVRRAGARRKKRAAVDPSQGPVLPYGLSKPDGSEDLPRRLDTQRASPGSVDGAAEGPAKGTTVDEQSNERGPDVVAQT